MTILPSLPVTGYTRTRPFCLLQVTWTFGYRVRTQYGFAGSDSSCRRVDANWLETILKLNSSLLIRIVKVKVDSHRGSAKSCRVNAVLVFC